MSLNLSKTIVRNAVATAAVCLIISLALAYFFGGSEMGVGHLGWPIALALGIGVFSGFSLLNKLKKGLIGSLLVDISYAEIDRAEYPDFDWRNIDDYAAQLEARGYKRLGDYTLYPPFATSTGVASCFLDAGETTLVEVQHMHLHLPPAQAAGIPGDAGAVHFSIFSLLAGRIPMTTTDRVAMATNYIMRGDLDVVSTFPGMPLLALLEKHAQLVAYMTQRTGKEVSAGLDMSRFIIVMRERFAQARGRLERYSGHQIAKQIDASPKTSWSTSSEILAQMEPRAIEEIDRSEAAGGRPPIIGSGAQGGNGQNAMAEAGSAPGAESIPAQVAFAQHAELAALRSRVESGASWFYWIAGLSAINAVVALMGSNWGFAIGLGISQVLTAIASELQKDASASGVIALILWMLSFGAIAFIAGCGYLARRPSTVAFVVGIAIFGLDTLIFLAAGDWIGVIFHFLALFFLWGGLSAGRELKKLTAK
jgi:hypothetical protein